MIKATLRLAWSAALLSAAHAAQQPPAAYRCTSPSPAGSQAEVRYQPHMCDGGQAMTHHDHRTAAQRVQASQAAQSDAKRARQMQRERRHQERQAEGRPPIAMDSAKPRPVVSNSTQGPTLKRERHFTVRPPKIKDPKAKSA
jgi:hypothetical protein